MATDTKGKIIQKVEKWEKTENELIWSKRERKNLCPPDSRKKYSKTTFRRNFKNSRNSPKREDTKKSKYNTIFQNEIMQRY